MKDSEQFSKAEGMGRRSFLAGAAILGISALVGCSREATRSFLEPKETDIRAELTKNTEQFRQGLKQFTPLGKEVPVPLRVMIEEHNDHVRQFNKLFPSDAASGIQSVEEVEIDE